MKKLTVSLVSDGRPLFQQVEIADTLWTRFKGLQLRKNLQSNAGILLVPGNCIHMFFMRFPIDAIFLDADNRIMKIAADLKPWRSMAVAKGAHSILEVGAGRAEEEGLSVGDKLQIIPVKTDGKQ